jgi:hypothetical protein
MTLSIVRTTLPSFLLAFAPACVDHDGGALTSADGDALARQGDALDPASLTEELLLGGCEVCPDKASGVAGGPGDWFSCWCTAEATAGGTVWGTDIYTDDSQLCRAAVHAGAIGPSGGIVTVTFSPGRDQYVGSLRHGVQSQAWGGWPRSLSIAADTSCCVDNSDCDDLVSPGPSPKPYDDIPYYCHKPEGACAGTGVCHPRPDACTQEYDPVLGCDGQEYGNACEAAAAGVSLLGGGV